MFNIKNILIMMMIMTTSLLSAQINPGASCAQAGCSMSGSYQSITGSSSMGQYGCLYSTPNPSWLAFNIQTTGSIHLQLTQLNSNGSPIDVDFALYGPYTSVAQGCPINGSTPTVDCSYSASATEYVDIPNAVAGQVYILLITNYNGSLGTITLQQSPNQPSSGTTGCSINFSANVTQTPATCGQATGTVSVTPNGGYAPYTYSWSIPGNPTTSTVNNVPPGTYTVTVSSSNGPQGQTVNPTTATITVSNITPTYSSSSTLVSCPGGSDGTATAAMNNPQGTITYLWDDPLAQTTQTAVGLSAGTYQCTVTSSNGCVGTVSVTVSEIPAMVVTLVNKSDVTCNSGNDGVIEINTTQGTAPYTYSWSSSASTSNVANDLFFGSHTITVTDANGCVTNYIDSVGQPLPLTITFTTPDTIICPDALFNLRANGSGGSSPYTFTWTSNGQVIGQGTSVPMDMNLYTNPICVEMSEACGSPTTSECITVTYPNPLIPILTPDKTKDCQPAVFTYTNNTPYPNEILTTYINFGNGRDTLVNGNATVSSLYTTAQMYDVSATVVSIYGCQYSAFFPSIVEATMIPTAGFNMSSNPTSFFETDVKMQDKSTPVNSIVSWQWSAPDGSPMTSTSQNPMFSFPVGEIGTYPIQLIVTTDIGCSDTITNYLNVVSDILFFAPNTFTPDGDEYNQTWKFSIQGIDIFNFDLYIYNRWGELIWESHDPAAEWDGTYNNELIPDGVYIWQASVKDIYSDYRKEFKGYINVLR